MTNKTFQIIIEIDDDGNFDLEGLGFTGTACDAAMKQFEDMGVVNSRTNKPEYDASGKRQVVNTRINNSTQTTQFQTRN